MLSPSRVRHAPSWSPPRDRSTMTSRNRSWLPSTDRELRRSHRQPRGGRAAARAGLAALEEVAEEDRVDLVLGVVGERLAEPVDVTLHVTDDQGGSGHGLRIRSDARHQPPAAARRVRATSERPRVS